MPGLNGQAGAKGQAGAPGPRGFPGSPGADVSAENYAYTALYTFTFTTFVLFCRVQMVARVCLDSLGLPDQLAEMVDQEELD